jgi:hypothetical protein
MWVWDMGYPPTILYEYQNTGLTKFAFCKLMILKDREALSKAEKKVENEP